MNTILKQERKIVLTWEKVSWRNGRPSAVASRRQRYPGTSAPDRCSEQCRLLCNRGCNVTRSFSFASRCVVGKLAAPSLACAFWSFICPVRRPKLCATKVSQITAFIMTQRRAHTWYSINLLRPYGCTSGGYLNYSAMKNVYWLSDIQGPFDIRQIYSSHFYRETVYCERGSPASFLLSFIPSFFLFLSWIFKVPFYFYRQPFTDVNTAKDSFAQWEYEEIETRSGETRVPRFPRLWVTSKVRKLFSFVVYSTPRTIIIFLNILKRVRQRACVSHSN